VILDGCRTDQWEQDLVRELVIAHAKPGCIKVYDQHAYQEEKRKCLGL